MPREYYVTLLIKYVFTSVHTLLAPATQQDRGSISERTLWRRQSGAFPAIIPGTRWLMQKKRFRYLPGFICTNGLSMQSSHLTNRREALRVLHDKQDVVTWLIYLLSALLFPLDPRLTLPRSGCMDAGRWYMKCILKFYDLSFVEPLVWK